MASDDNTDTDFSDLDDASFGLELDETGGLPGGYHTSNNPQAPYQRQTVTERRGPVDIRCKAREVVHGFMSPDNDAFATFLVYDFHFDASKRFRRVAWADVTFQFSSSEAGVSPPEVVGMVPLGRYALLPTTQETSYTREGGLNADVGGFGATVGASATLSKTVSGTVTTEVKVVGNKVCDVYGRETGVSWSLHENEGSRKGVPSFFRAAILLKREQDVPFECTVKIDVEADWRTQMRRFWGSKPKDDPILFDPDMPPTNKLRGKYDTENLGGINLDEFFDITFETMFDSAVKTHSLASPE